MPTALIVAQMLQFFGGASERPNNGGASQVDFCASAYYLDNRPLSWPSRPGQANHFRLWRVVGDWGQRPIAGITRTAK